MSTEGVPEREQFGYWREFGARQFWSLRWERDGPAAAPFRGRLRVLPIGEARLIDLRCQSHRSVRDRAAAARVSEDVYLVQQEVFGATRYEVGRSSFACHAGDLVIHPPDAAITEEGPSDWATRIWVIPRRRLLPLLPARTGPSLHIPRRDGIAALAAAAAETLALQADRLQPAAADAVLDGFCRLLAIAAGVAAPAIEGGREALRAACLARVRGHVDQRLADPELDPGRVARAVGVSERQLHRLFEPTGESFARYVLRRRLEEARAAMAVPGGRPVTELAMAWGFGSLPTFYRAFRKTFGQAPGDVRAAAAAAAEAEAASG